MKDTLLFRLILLAVLCSNLRPDFSHAKMICTEALAPLESELSGLPTSAQDLKKESARSAFGKVLFSNINYGFGWFDILDKAVDKLKPRDESDREDLIRAITTSLAVTGHDGVATTLWAIAEEKPSGWARFNIFRSRGSTPEEKRKILNDYIDKLQNLRPVSSVQDVLAQKFRTSLNTMLEYIDNGGSYLLTAQMYDNYSVFYNLSYSGFLIAPKNSELRDALVKSIAKYREAHNTIMNTRGEVFTATELAEKIAALAEETRGNLRFNQRTDSTYRPNALRTLRERQNASADEMVRLTKLKPYTQKEKDGIFADLNRNFQTSGAQLRAAVEALLALDPELDFTYETYYLANALEMTIETPQGSEVRAVRFTDNTSLRQVEKLIAYLRAYLDAGAI